MQIRQLKSRTPSFNTKAVPTGKPTARTARCSSATRLLKKISWQACQKASLTLELSPYIFCLVSSVHSHRTSSGVNTCGFASHAYTETDSMQWRVQRMHCARSAVESVQCFAVSPLLFLRIVSESLCPCMTMKLLGISLQSTAGQIVMAKFPGIPPVCFDILNDQSCLKAHAEQKLPFLTLHATYG